MTRIAPLATAHIDPRTLLGSYERNSKAFGPVVAGVMGAAEAVGDAASATCEFSSEALAQLQASMEHGVAAVEAAVQGAAHAVADAGCELGHEVAETVGEVVDGIAGAAGLVAAAVLNAPA